MYIRQIKNYNFNFYYAIQSYRAGRSFITVSGGATIHCKNRGDEGPGSTCV